MKTNKFFSLPPLHLILAFVIPWLYWIYLFFTTQMEIRFDAMGFEQLAFIIRTKGLASAFQVEPQQSLLYPVIISGAMRLAEIFQVHYQVIEKIIQILILLLSQFLVWRILNVLRIRPWIISLTVFYFGISPAIVNSAFSLYSEIITYPFVLGIVLASMKSWELILKSEKTIKIIAMGAIIGVFFLALVCVRAIYEYVILVYCFGWINLALVLFCRKDKKAALKTLAVIVSSLLIFETGVEQYKQMNLKYNGHHTTVIVGAWAVYGVSASRTQPLTQKQWLEALSMIPGRNVCYSLFGEQDCSFWVSQQVKRGMDKIKELSAQGVPNPDLDHVLFKLAKETILNHPLQYGTLCFMESLKMLFWESTKIGFVTYPEGLRRLFSLTLFKDGLRLLMTILTLMALIFSLNFMVRSYPNLFELKNPEHSKTAIVFFSLLLILANIALHALFVIDTRYALPIAPLYLILIALIFQKVFGLRSQVLDHPNT